MKRTKKTMLGVIALCVLLCASALTACNKRTTPATDPDPEPKTIDYTITVACDDESVLSSAQVQLFAGATAATEAKNLDSDHKAVFSLKAATYNVSIGGIEGYTYTPAIVTAAIPRVTVTLTKEGGGEASTTYAVTYLLGKCGDTDYAGITPLPIESEKKENEKFNLAGEPVWGGYIFKGWNDGTNTYAAGYEYTMPADNVEFTAQWEKETYAVTYDFGSCDGTPYAGSTTDLPTETKKELDEKFTLASEPVWGGYIFNGWNDGTNTYGAGYEYTMPARAVKFTAQWEKEPEMYAVTYTSARCNGADYAGDPLPAETEKAGGRKFTLPAAPVWADHMFMGWSDGTNTYAAGAEYNMPEKPVTLTATWMGYVKADIDVPDWNEGAESGGYQIFKGQHVTISAYISWKSTGDSAYGILGKIFPNSTRSNNYFYQFRCDFAIKRNNWSWNENNDGFTVSNGGYDRDTYRETSYGDTEITVALSSDGVLTYTFKFTSDEYSHNRVFTDTVKMNSAVVIFGADNASTEKASIEFPASDALTLKLDTGCDDSDWTTTYDITSKTYIVSENSTFKIDYFNPTREGYDFLGWQISGEGEYYMRDDYISIGSDSLTLMAAWRLSVTIFIDKNGAERNPKINHPAKTYDEESGKYIIEGLPGFNVYTLTKTGYRYDGWDVYVDDKLIEVDGPFSVDPGAYILYKIRWAVTYYVTYAYGKCGDTNYGGWSAQPKQDRMAEGDTFTVAGAVEWNGYRFLGWHDGTSLYQPGDTYTMPGKSVTLTAQWEKIEDTASAAATICGYIVNTYEKVDLLFTADEVQWKKATLLIRK